MKHLRWIVPLLFLLLWAAPAHAQYEPIQGWCEDGNQNATVSGINSTNTVQASYPNCTVTVLLHGGGAATLFSDDSGTPLANPFTADANGQFLFYVLASVTSTYDVTISGGTPIALPAPVTIFTGIAPSGGGASSLLSANNVWTGTNRWNNTSSFHANTDFCGKRPWRDVTCYGAVGDGSTDDGPAIQAAIDDTCANTTTGGGAIRFPTPSVNYFIGTTVTIDPSICVDVYLLGEPGPRGGGISQFARSPRVRVQGTAVPLFDIDNSTAGADFYVTFENIDLVSLNGMGIKLVSVPFFMFKNSGCSYDYDAMVTHSACISLEGSILWFTARDSNFFTLNNNTGPFNPAPGRTYDPTSWAPPAVQLFANSTHDGSVLWMFDNVTWGFGGFKITVLDNGAASCGQTFGEITMLQNVIEGQFASPLIQFENAQSADCVGQGATLGRVTMVESQLADVAHPTPVIAVKGQSMHTATMGSTHFSHVLSHMSCYVLGINGQENISGIWADTPQNVAYSCDQTGVPGTTMYMIRHTNGGIDSTAPVAGPTKYNITEDDGGAFRTFVPDGTNADNLNATMMIDNDGSSYFGAGGTSSFDLQSGRVGVQTWGLSRGVDAPTSLTATPVAGGTIPDGSYVVCVAAGDRNNTPFTVSACSTEKTFVMGAGNNTVLLSWTNSTGYAGKYTAYFGNAGSGSENHAANCGSACTTLNQTSYPVSNQIPNTVGNLLTSFLQAYPTGFKHNFNTAFNGLFAAVPTANRTWTFPDATLTVVGADTTQTLTNKTVLDNTFTIANSVAPTKTLGFDLSGATAAFKSTLAFVHTAARTYTFPDRTGSVCVSLGPCSVTVLTATQATGTPPLSISSTTPVANLSATPTTYDHAATQLTNAHLISDTCTLGTDCGVTLAGAAVFTTSTSYTCVAQDQTAIAATKVAQASGSAFTITGTGTDTIRYTCIGN